jgi:hypothetical protein
MSHYEAVERSRVAPVANLKVVECDPTGNYELGTLEAGWIVVAARYGEDGARARVLITVVVWPDHHVKFQTLDIRLSPLVDSTVSSLVPVSLYIDCANDDPERRCDHVPVAMQTLDGFRGSSQGARAFTGVARVPSGFVDGFIVTLPAIFDGSSRIDTKPLRFERRPGPPKKAGLSGCY